MIECKEQTMYMIYCTDCQLCCDLVFAQGILMIHNKSYVTSCYETTVREASQNPYRTLL